MTRKQLEDIAANMAELSMEYNGETEEDLMEELETASYADLLQFVGLA